MNADSIADNRRQLADCRREAKVYGEMAARIEKNRDLATPNGLAHYIAKGGDIFALWGAAHDGGNIQLEQAVRRYLDFDDAPYVLGVTAL